MEIEFKNLDGRIEVIEHTIRNTKFDVDSDQLDEKVEHLQARLLVNDFDGDCVNCSISYYSSDNVFLGLNDSGPIYLTPASDRSVSVSLPMDIPEKTVKVVVRLLFDDEVSGIIGFYGYALRALFVLLLAWLAMVIIKTF